MDTLKYEITDRRNSLQKYNFFLKNMSAKTTMQELVTEILKEKKVVKVFDLGCGEGSALKELKKEFGKKIVVFGMDLLETNGLDEFVKGDANKVTFPKNCDLVFSFRVLHEIANLEKNFEKLSNCMTKKAKAFLSIRVQQQISNKIVFHENLEKKDLEFLQKIEKTKHFKNLEVLVIEIEQKSLSGKKIITGINVFLRKN